LIAGLGFDALDVEFRTISAQRSLLIELFSLLQH
jgi:hypothetical protein